MKKYLIIGIVFLFLSLSLSLSLLFKERQNRIRLQANQRTLISDANFYKLKDSSQVATIGTLEMTVKDLKNANNIPFTILKEKIEAMAIKLRHVENISTAQITNTKEFITHSVRDTLIYDTVPARIWNYQDKFYNIQALEFENNRDVKIIYRDRMTQIVHREKKGWKFWKRSKLVQSINFENPNTEISYPQYIEVKK